MSETTRTVFVGRMDKEADAQDEKWGKQVHSGHAWVAILTEEVGELAAAVNEEQTARAAKELVQIATVAMRAFEQQMDGDGLLLPEWGQCKQTPAEAKGASHEH
jgi:hypothetical protein